MIEECVENVYVPLSTKINERKNTYGDGKYLHFIFIYRLDKCLFCQHFFHDELRL